MRGPVRQIPGSRASSRVRAGSGPPRPGALRPPRPRASAGTGPRRRRDRATTATPSSGDGCGPNCLHRGLRRRRAHARHGGVRRRQHHTPATACTADCTCEPEVCGDGIDGCLEECDDGNTVDGDGCEPTAPRPTLCSPSTKAQLACIRAINRNLAGVIKAQSADDATCVRSVAAGKHPGDRRLPRPGRRREGGEGAGQDPRDRRQEVQRRGRDAALRLHGCGDGERAGAARAPRGGETRPRRRSERRPEERRPGRRGLPGRGHEAARRGREPLGRARPTRPREA